MIDMSLLELVFLIASLNTSITTSFIQKTKKYFRKSKYIPYYSLVVNIVFGILFSISFTSIGPVKSLWVGVFSFLESDTLYKSLEGKLSSFENLRN